MKPEDILRKGKTDKGKRQVNLENVAKMYPTPRAHFTGNITPTRCADQFNNLESVLSRRMWPTPKDSPSGPDFARMNRPESGGDDLATAIARSTWATPAASDGQRGGKITPNMTGQSLTQMVNSVNLWPAPNRNDYKGSGKSTGKLRDKLDYAAERHETNTKLLPTPTNSMVTENDFVQAKFHSSKRGKYTESKFPTPTCDDADNSTLPISQRDRDNLPGYCLRNREQPGGQLNPDWVEFLMGWPIGWTSLEPLTDPLWLDWSVDPADTGDIPRVSTGIKNRVSRLQAIGNGQVPLCFATAWIILFATFIKQMQQV